MIYQRLSCFKHEIEKRKRKKNLSVGFFFFFNWVRHKAPPPAGERGRMGVGVFARLQHTPGIRQWDPRAENWVPICASIWGPESETGSHSPGGRYLEMGGVCLA